MRTSEKKSNPLFEFKKNQYKYFKLFLNFYLKIIIIYNFK